MNTAIVIPTYWASESCKLTASGVYDHSTSLDSTAPELDRCLSSLEQVRKCGRVIILVVCPPQVERAARARVDGLAAAHPTLQTTIISHTEAAAVVDAVSAVAPSIGGEAVSLRGYGAIRNVGLAVARILSHDSVVFLDDDEVVLGPDFLLDAEFGLGRQTRQGLPILAKSGYFYDSYGSPLASSASMLPSDRWWTKRKEFNQWMSAALCAKRISRSNYVCGGCFVLHARAFSRVAFDPWITRGEDLDYLLNMRMFGMDVWFDNKWVVKHLPPSTNSEASRFMQDVYRWYYERAKLAYAARQHDLVPVTASSLMPYPGPWISSQLDERVRRTAAARAVVRPEKKAYADILTHGRRRAEHYARANASRYIRLQSFWPSIMDSLWNNTVLAEKLEGGA